jgi:hypothetical protein
MREGIADAIIGRTMSPKLPIKFPSQVSRIERQVEAERGWSASQRIAAVAESLDVVRALAAAGGRAAGQLEYRRLCKERWRQRMKDFIARQLQHHHANLPTEKSTDPAAS